MATAIPDAATHDANAAAYASANAAACIQVHFLRRQCSGNRSQDLYSRLDSLCPAVTILYSTLLDRIAYERGLSQVRHLRYYPGVK
jgi:hypothetical protein